MTGVAPVTPPGDRLGAEGGGAVPERPVCDGPAASIAAVVVTHNRLPHLRRTVERLLEEAIDHLLVIDNASTDGSRDWLAGQSDPRLLPIFLERNGGGSLGFETGMREAVARFDPDWLLLMDDDARPSPGAVARFRAGTCAGEWGHAEAVTAAVYFPDGRICEMNRPWVNPFSDIGVFLRVLAGGGRRAFHIPDAAFTAPGPRPIDGTSFVGLFLSRAAMRRAGYVDGRLFIYGDDVLYTLGLSQAGGRILFSPGIRFEHDCSTQAAGAVFRPLWKTYYLHRNQWFVYRKAAGRWLFWPLMTVMAPKWLLKGRSLDPEERRIYRRLIRLAMRDALKGNFGRSHDEITARSRRVEGKKPGTAGR